MPNKILTVDGWQERIRSKFRLTPNQLPDADIGQPDIISVAEAMVIDAVLNWAEILAGNDENKKIYLESAVVNACCMLLCPSMSQRLALVKGPLMTVDYGDIDWKEKAIEFQQYMNADIGRCRHISMDEYSPVVPFMVSGPTRSGKTVIK